MVVVLCSPNAFKGSLKALSVAEALARGVGDAGARAHVLPMADGGDGTLDVLLSAAPEARVERAWVIGPSGRRILARLGWTDRRSAVVELAEAAGLRRLRGQLCPLTASSYGVGQLVRQALYMGAERVLIGVGGSACTDGGSGLLAALGARLLGREGREVGLGGGALCDITDVDLSGLDPRVRASEISVAVDVSNPLVGPEGAAVTFAPQKGATPAEVSRLAACLGHWADVLERDAGVSPGLRMEAGGGAAGGAAYGLAAIGATLRPGAPLVAEAIGLDDAIAAAQLVITGEGRLDQQTAKGKAPLEVALRARNLRIPCIAIAGRVDVGLDVFSAVISLSTVGKAGEDPLHVPRRLLRRAAKSAVLQTLPQPMSTAGR